MAGDQASLITEWVLPAAVCAPVTWVCLIFRFREDGRLLGTVRSAGLTVAVVLWTSGMAAVASGLLLPHASSVPPVAVGAAAGWGVAPRGREQGDKSAVMAVLTLGNSLLLHQLALRLRTDRAEWCERMAGGFRDCWDLDAFAGGVRHHLLLRVDAPGRPVRLRTQMKREINERYNEVRTAAQRWITLETKVQKSCQQHARPATRDEIRRVRRAFGEAEQYLVCLLELAHAHGKRSDAERLLELKRQHLSCVAMEQMAGGSSVKA
ncbi:hypothetical protein [Streptomyces morookaense]|uniref:Uncharacterized protein n=1 Tax=Streptomyces morookaense TaxID=1970 RepID=A0A7Y7E5L7_STRMO|nr:hypothetical protein [Streptomyces morookaense]NVK77043.1 hypothetical protein [Streptomyces morookaense]GHF23556.1 hypothetical protein GCM10010359_27160 [Streptomyces morookaense]